MMSANISDWNGDVKNSLTLDSPTRMLDGFPWVSAIILYTLSWGWSLLRPNTLYWDDWEIFFDRPKLFFTQLLHQAGRAPWAGLVEPVLIGLGTWAVCIATFIVFFSAGIFLFGILQKLPKFSQNQIRLVTILFLVIPVNHARVAVSIFDYSSSYFLFFLAWLMIVRLKSNLGFVCAWLFLFLSFKTHSILFFVLLPLLHYSWLYRSEHLNFKKVNFYQIKLALIAFAPLLYVTLRNSLWPPSESWVDYQKLSLSGLRTGLLPIILGLVALAFILFRLTKGKPTKFGWVMLVTGFLVTALALLPYFAGDLYVGYAGRPAYITVFEFRADWRSRHQLLMPLGLALTVVGLNELFKFRGKNVILTAVLVISVSLNMFWGSQYFLMSHKQEQLVNLFKTTKDKIEIASVEDDTKRFNGRESTFRGYEWAGFMTLAEIPTEMPGCEALPNGSALILKSDTSYLKALVTRDIGLYFEVTPCVEVLAKDG